MRFKRRISFLKVSCWMFLVLIGLCYFLTENSETIDADRIIVSTVKLYTTTTFTEEPVTEPDEKRSFETENRTALHIQNLDSYTKCLHELKLSRINQFNEYHFSEVEELFRKTCFAKLYGDKHANLCEWPARGLRGRLEVNKKHLRRSEVTNRFRFVRTGGWWIPEVCVSRHKVAIIVPYRDRQVHLEVLLRQLHTMLRRQQLMYRIFIIQQTDEYPFNRGKLMNVGFTEASRLSNFTCFVFHDVDLIPENDRNFYGCAASPSHLSRAVDKFQYKLPYQQIFGGVEMFTVEDFRKVNGFPNAFWGWGAEDDDLYHRVAHHGLTLSRPTEEEGRYIMLEHNEAKDKPPNRHVKLSNGFMGFLTDGINSLQYKRLNVHNERLYTLVRVDLNMEGDMLY